MNSKRSTPQNTSTSMSCSTEEVGFQFEPNVLPPYAFDPLLSEDDNFMLWAMIYIRSSVSRRGQM